MEDDILRGTKNSDEALNKDSRLSAKDRHPKIKTAKPSRKLLNVDKDGFAYYYQ